MKKLNLGCGHRVVDGWINVDYALGAWLFKVPLFSVLNRKLLHLFKTDWDRRIFIHDLRRTLPFKDESIGVVYSSHTLEHFTREDGKLFLEECYRVLSPNGIIRIVVPDLKIIVEDYMIGNMRADNFCENLICSPRLSDAGMIRRFLSSMFAYPHQCMYDTETLLSILKDIGFCAKSRKPFESNIANIRDVELEDRASASVIVEGTKAVANERKV